MEDIADFVKGPQWEADNKTIEHAKEILRKRLCPKDEVMIKHQAEMLDYLKMRVGGLEHEAFGIVFLGVRGNIIDCQEMFRGTLTETPAYIREMMKATLRNNAAAIVLYHNHPSGSAEPSQPDIKMTLNVMRAMKMIGVQVLDHILVAADKTTSIGEVLKEEMTSKSKFSGLPPQLAAMLGMLGIDADQFEMAV